MIVPLKTPSLPFLASSLACAKIGKFAFGDRTIPIHARTLGQHASPNAMGVYYGTVQSAVLHTN